MLDLKEQGNALYREGDYLKAAAAYSKAIKADPNNHVLYRSACKQAWSQTLQLKNMYNSILSSCEGSSLCVNIESESWEKCAIFTLLMASHPACSTVPSPVCIWLSKICCKL